MESEGEKPLIFVGSSRAKLMEFPREVIRNVGFGLGTAQLGGRAHGTKVLKGFGGAGVIEVREDFASDTYRAVYTVPFDEAVYVLHCFQKQSTRGSETPKPDRETIQRRLSEATLIHETEQRKMP